MRHSSLLILFLELRARNNMLVTHTERSEHTDLCMRRYSDQSDLLMPPRTMQMSRFGPYIKFPRPQRDNPTRKVPERHTVIFVITPNDRFDRS